MMLEYDSESSSHLVTLFKSNRMVSDHIGFSSLFLNMLTLFVVNQAITGRALNISNLMRPSSEHR